MTSENLDLLGVGFGPAGIALAAALEDWHEGNPEAPRNAVHFLEARANSAWHDALMLPGADLSHPYQRDFATPRNPRSRFTFPQFLFEKGRLFEFGLHDGAPLRSEWSEYVLWAAEKLASYVDYNAPASGIEPVIENGRVVAVTVTTPNGQAYTTRHLALSTGQKANIPDQFAPFVGDRFFHTTQFADRVAKLDRQKPLSFVVIGSGQSAAESLVYLYDKFEKATFHSLHRRVAFKQLDDSHFSQQIYFPQETDYYFSLPLEARQRALKDIFLTNYASVDFRVSQQLYDRMYEDKVMGQERVTIHHRRLIQNIEERDGRYHLTVGDTYTGEPIDLEADVVIFCTGFYEPIFPELLEPLREFITIDSQGGPSVTRDYRVETVDHFEPLIYLNGLCERTHGMSDSTSWSMLAIKAQHILDSWHQHAGIVPA